MSRIPLVPTLIVGLAVALMVALGFWQLDRRTQKEAFLAQIAANSGRPPVTLPQPSDDRLLFRRARADCRAPIAISRAGAGAAGYRLIASCAGGVAVQLGTTRLPTGDVTWGGGRVAGWITHVPDRRPMIAAAFDRTPAPLLLVSDVPLAGLAPNRRPDIDTIPNNHLAYAGQWFFFAGVALAIYALALRRRRSAGRGDVPPR